MITPGYVRAMAAYNAAINERVYAASARLDDADRRAGRGAFWTSIHGTLSHLMWGDTMWMSRFDGWTPPRRALAESHLEHMDFAEMHAARHQADARITAWAANLAPDWLGGQLTWYSGAAKRQIVAPRGVLVVHFFNHQTHHRGQVHAMLTAAGEDVGPTDLPMVLPPEMLAA